jgi:nucleoside-diphosphate-sugar epimerase
MIILVTGGTGFVGNHLISELLKEKDNFVYVLVRDETKLDRLAGKERVSVIAGDLFSAEPFPDDIEVVFHLAALTKVVSPEEFVRCNHDGTRSLMEKLRPLTRLRKVVLLSSLAAVGPNRHGHGLTEGQPESPVSRYGKSKLDQEGVLKEFCPAPYIILRAPIVFGPGDMDMLSIFRILARGFLPELGRQERVYSIIYVKDLVRGMIAAARSACENETFYIANSDPVTWVDFVRETTALLGKKRMKKVFIPRVLAWFLAELSETRVRISKRKNIFNRDKFREMRFPVWTCSVEKIQQRLHFQAQYPFNAAMRETIHWYLERNLL